MRKAWIALALCACGSPSGGESPDAAPAPDAALAGAADASPPAPDAAEPDAALPQPDAAPVDAAPPAPDAVPPAPDDPCPPGVVCIEQLPFDTIATTIDGDRAFDAYACAPDTDESGPEVVYRLDVAEPGFLALAVDGMPDGVDVDVHLLRADDPDACLDRGDKRAGGWVEAGRYWIVADTWVDGDGYDHPGDYHLTAALTTPATLAAAGMDPDVAARGLHAFGVAWSRGDTDRFEYALIDFSLRSDKAREWIVDLRTSQILWNLHVAHGRGSNDPDDSGYARIFSNVPESHKSSLGLMRSAEPYEGDYGPSFRLDGLEPGYNDRVRDRDIVVHPWTGSRDEYVAEHGETAPTWGCPAIDDRLAPEVRERMAGGALFWFWYPDGDWSERSTYLR